MAQSQNLKQMENKKKKTRKRTEKNIIPTFAFPKMLSEKCWQGNQTMVQIEIFHFHCARILTLTQNKKKLSLTNSKFRVKVLTQKST